MPPSSRGACGPRSTVATSYKLQVTSYKSRSLRLAKIAYQLPDLMMAELRILFWASAMVDFAESPHKMALDAHKQMLEQAKKNQATSKGRALALKEREHDRQGVQLNEQLTNLQAARLQVHEQQLAVQKQVSDVKRAMIALRALEGRVSLGNNHHLVAGGGGGGGVAAAGVLTVTTAEGRPAAGASVSSLSPGKGATSSSQQRQGTMSI